MSREHNGSESQRRKVQLRAPYIVGEYAEAAGLKVTDVIDDLAGMRIFARPQFAISQEIIEKLSAKHGIQVEFIPRQ